MSRQRRSKSVNRQVESKPAEPQNDAWPIWAALALLLVGYLALFCQTQLGGEDGISRGMLYLLPPFDPGEFWREWTGGDSGRIGVLDRLPVVALVLIWLTAAHLAGSLLFRALAIEIGSRDPLEHIAFTTPIGLQLMSLVSLTLGLTANGLGAPWMLSRWPLLALIGSLAMVSVARPQWVAPWWNASQGADSGASKVTERPWVLMLAVPFAILLIACSLLPPWEFDVREYHLQAPKEWYRGGGVSFLPHNVYANMPLGAEMHAFGAMILWGGEDGWWRGALVGKGVLGSMNLLTALAIYVCLARSVGRFAGGVAAVLYVSWPFAFHVATAGLIDAALALYVALTFLGFERWRAIKADDEDASSARRSWLLLTALAAGAAASCKYPGLLMAVTPAALALGVTSVFREGAKSALKIGFIALAIGLVTASPWYVKNLVLASNPVYPMLASTLGGETRTSAKNKQWRDAHATPRDSDGRSFTATQTFNSVAQVLWRFPQHHPLVIPLALLGLVGAATRHRAFAAWTAIGLLFAVWFLLTHRIDRFWLPLGPLFCIAAGIGAASGRSRHWRNAISAILATASFFVFTYCASRYLTPENRALVAYSELRRDLPNPADPMQWTLTPSHDFLNRSTNPDSTVLLVGDAQPFDLNPRSYYSTCFDDCLLEQWLSGKSSTEFHAVLRERQVQYVLVNWGEIARYRATYGFTDFVQHDVLEKLQRDNVLRLVSYEGESLAVEIFEVVADE